MSCGIVAGTIAFCFQSYFEAFGGPIVRRIEAIGLMPAMAVTAILGLTAIRFVGNGRWRGCFGLRHIHSYPPLWLAVIVGVVTWSGAVIWVDGAVPILSNLSDIAWFRREIPIEVRWALLSTLAFTLLVIHRSDSSAILSRRSKKPNSSTSSLLLEKDFEGLRAWVQTDDKVSLPHHDRFGHDKVARRLAGRLMMKEAPTMALGDITKFCGWR